jgi:hypothetical protein
VVGMESHPCGTATDSIALLVNHVSYERHFLCHVSLFFSLLFAVCAASYATFPFFLFKKYVL